MADGKIVLTLDLNTLQRLSLTIDGKEATEDPIPQNGFDLDGYQTMSAFETWSFMAFKDKNNQVVARYGIWRNGKYYWI